MVAEKEFEWRSDEVAAAELLWCAAYMDRILKPPEPVDTALENAEAVTAEENRDETRVKEDFSGSHEPQETEEAYQPVYAGQQPNRSARSDADAERDEFPSDGRASPVRVPVPFPLPQPSELSKALLPFARRVPGLRATELDIDETVERTAEANGLPIPVFQRPLQRWFDVCLLIDHSPSMEFWGDLGESVATLFRWQGIFRDVRVWQFDTHLEGRPRLLSGADAIEREVESLITPGQDRLFVVVTDTLGKAWKTGQAFNALAVLGAKHPVAIAHVFPKYLWPRTALERAIERPLVASAPGCANDRLMVATRLRRKTPVNRFPIFNLSERHFLTWAKHVAEAGGNSIQGVLLAQQREDAEPETDRTSSTSSTVADQEQSPEALVNTFLGDATPEAAQLASILAAVPLIPMVMRLAQEQFMPDTRHWHLAEVFFSGLVQRSPISPANAGVANRWYEFREGVRDVLLQRSPVRTTTEVWREIGSFIEQNLDSLRDALGLVPNPSGSMENVQLASEFYFAEVKGAVLKTWGGEFARQGQALIDEAKAYKHGPQDPIDTDGAESVFPELQDIEIIDAQLIEGTDLPPLSRSFPPPLQTENFTIVTFSKLRKQNADLERFGFVVATLNRVGMSWEVARQNRTAYRLIETLPKVASSSILGGLARRLGLGGDEDEGDVLTLEMVSIPAGTFLMGLPDDEPNRYGDESPQHSVTIQPFLLGRYPVTQAQWRTVAALPQVNRELKSDPARFKGDDRPVEQISWNDATEFCDRLSAYSGRQYRLPSEAEWEYACRAGTQTPFHFGETMTTEVANYRGSSFGGGPQGEFRRATTAVTFFEVANAFGLSDMHGNVWEWCQDDWHNSYERAPTDGSAWTEGGDSTQRVVRGGAWDDEPTNCRSASRSGFKRDDSRFSGIGFRVACSTESD
jgi:formylglycine-generating enzyme required for sulfatase activity